MDAMDVCFAQVPDMIKAPRQPHDREALGDSTADTPPLEQAGGI